MEFYFNTLLHINIESKKFSKIVIEKKKYSCNKVLNSCLKIAKTNE